MKDDQLLASAGRLVASLRAAAPDLDLVFDALAAERQPAGSGRVAVVSLCPRTPTSDLEGRYRQAFERVRADAPALSSGDLTAIEFVESAA